MPSQYNDPRHNTRIVLVQYFFLRAFNLNSGNDVLFPNFTDLSEISEITKIDKQMANNIHSGIEKNLEKIDEIISKLAPEWPLENIAKIDLQILRIAICEGFIIKITPEKVAIDEAIELAKEFSNDQSRKFISGVLGNLIANKEKYTIS